MKVNFYSQGDVVPMAYDYGMDTDGVLIPSRIPRSKDAERITIVLELGRQVPTPGQRETINIIRTINPTWDLGFFFQPQGNNEGTKKRHMH